MRKYLLALSLVISPTNGCEYISGVQPSPDLETAYNQAIAAYSNNPKKLAEIGRLYEDALCLIAAQKPINLILGQILGITQSTN